MLGESVIIDLSAKKSMLNANLKTIRRFLHEGTMYCEFSKNFIPESKYTRIYNEYLTVFNDYSMHVAHSLKITNQGENLSIPEFELLFAKSDDLLKQIKSSKYHRELDLEIRRIHINMLEELTQNQSQTVEIVSTFYPKHEYEVLKSKLE